MSMAVRCGYGISMENYNDRDALPNTDRVATADAGQAFSCVISATGRCDTIATIDAERQYNKT